MADHKVTIIVKVEHDGCTTSASMDLAQAQDIKDLHGIDPVEHLIQVIENEIERGI